MKLLLDTHVFIWWSSEPSRMTPSALALCEDPINEVLLSVASAWEMQIKLHLGKMTLRTTLSEMIETQQRVNGLRILTVELPHVLALARLPDHHRDPFDRILVAQASVEGARLVSHDPILLRYGVPVAW